MRQHNPLFRLLMWNWLAGAAAALVLIGGLIATDAMRIRHLIFASDNPVVPLAMLTIGFLITMCSVAMGTAVMLLPSDEDDDGKGPGGGSPLEVLRMPKLGPSLAPAPVRAEASHRPVRRY